MVPLTTGEVETANRTAQSGRRPPAWLASGLAAGAISALVFTWVHQLTISNIWFMVGPMLIAGSLSGLCIAWCFQRVFVNRSIGTWLALNGAFLAMFGLLAGASVLLLEPVTTMAELSAASGPVDHLIVQALPVTALVAVLTTAIAGRFVAQRWTDYLRLLLTVVVLMVLVGLNISVLGLVDFGGASLLPVVKFLALVVLLDAVYALAYPILLGMHSSRDQPRYVRLISTRNGSPTRHGLGRGQP